MNSIIDEVTAVHVIAGRPRPTLNWLVTELLATIDEGDGEVDATIEALGMSIEDKVSAYVAVHETLLTEAAALKVLARETSERIKGRAESKERDANGMRDRLLFEFERLGVTKFKTPSASPFVRTDKHVEISDVEGFLKTAPAELVRVNPETRAPAKAAIKFLLERGTPVPGAELIESKTLIMK